MILAYHGSNFIDAVSVIRSAKTKCRAVHPCFLSLCRKQSMKLVAYYTSTFMAAIFGHQSGADKVSGGRQSDTSAAMA